mgnify:CR=1 FL=1
MAAESRFAARGWFAWPGVLKATGVSSCNGPEGVKIEGQARVLTY